MAAQGGGGGGGEAVSLDQLSPPQLNQLKKQLDDEVEHLTASLTQLHGAQSKFRDCLRCVRVGGGGSDKSPATALEEDKSILVPLTTSLYVRGKLSGGSRVLVDVGTGFYVEKDTASAAHFYERTVARLGANMKQVEVILQAKANNVRVLEEVLRQKLAAVPQQAQQTQ